MADNEEQPPPAAAAKEQQPPKPDEAEFRVLSIIVKDQSGNEVHFKVRPQAKMEKIFNAYCERKSLEVAAVRFLFDGTRIHASASPEGLGMEDGDSIDCVIEQIGGLATC